MARRLSDLSVEEREKHLWEIFVNEIQPFRESRDDEMVEVFRYLRGLSDEGSPYKTKMRHPYAFAAAQAIKAAVWPVLLAADPAVQIYDPNPDNYDRNQVSEELLTGHIKNPLLTNFPSAWEGILDDAIWFGWSAPWTYFRSRTQDVGPFWRPSMRNGYPVLSDDGSPVLEESYERVRTYHAPWLERVDPFDSFLHPDGRRGLTRRDATGYEMLGQSEGSNPIYDREAVARMINLEADNVSAKKRDEEGYHAGSDYFRDRDLLASEAGSEPPRHSEIEASKWDQDILAKPFVLMHYDDGECHGTYAVRSGGGFTELRFFRGVNYDGAPNRLLVKTWQSPQEVHGTSFFTVAKDLLRFQTRLYQAAGDAAALQVQPMFVGSGQMRMSGQELVFSPGGVVWTPTVTRSVDEHFRKLDTGGEFMNTFQLVDVALKRDLDMMFAQGDTMRGLVASGRRTAFETSAAMASGEGRIEVVIKKLFGEFVVPLVRKWLAMMTVHYTRRDYANMLGSKGMDYVPPTIPEIVGGLQYIPKGSLTMADSQLRRAQWPAIFDASLKALPYLQVPHIREMYKRMMEDMGQEAVTRVIPSAEGPQFTEYQSRIMKALEEETARGGGAGGEGGIGSPPKSPGDIGGLLAGLGGRMAPPGPAGQGVPVNGNGR